MYSSCYRVCNSSFEDRGPSRSKLAVVPTGGMVLGPAMLELGLHPLVTASTSLLLVGASSSSATIEFSLAHELPHSWALIVFVLCFVASLVGVAVIGRYVRASGRASVIVFLLTFLTFVGGILTAVRCSKKASFNKL